ncbi:hypothetical protein SHI21_14500 [Bacteriovorax sp. PP10]|uniref:Uncharacterized protein n=1 Tax=Bacteriovorax antarcticus TaxID=3088717 RepID=A0ABU5VYN8_9BACT|nr:hypothetical protein [Bacteriovorax sp. PP10]MEA9357434.1 hypothetical protein [Bacteriovorax sp. PP10]
MVQDKKFSSGKKATTDTSKNLDNRKGHMHTPDKDTAHSGSMKDQNLSKDKDIGSKRDVGSRK